MVEVEWSEAAKNDLKEIFEYLTQHSSQYAYYFNERIFESIENLQKFPQIGKMVLDFNDPSIKEIVIQNYRLVYKYEESKIEILTVIHGSRLLKI